MFDLFKDIKLKKQKHKQHERENNTSKLIINYPKPTRNKHINTTKSQQLIT